MYRNKFTLTFAATLLGLAATFAPQIAQAQPENNSPGSQNNPGQASGSTANESVIELRQSDFAQGTLRITSPGVYRLMENISFNPHPVGSPGPDGQTPLDAYSAGRPFWSQYGHGPGQYDPAAYGIGFFAAIAVEADNVTIDLNGFRLEQSAEHALHQRFFAVIELADQPFIPSQGPSDFGNNLVAANNVIIRNGTIGRSSHHGIHGNDNSNVVIQNIRFRNYEVAALALNGVNDLVVRDCDAKNRRDVPILGTFSNARFISAYVDWLVATQSQQSLQVQGSTLTPAQIQTALRDSINNVFEDVIEDQLGFIDPVEHPAEYALYHNRFGVVDGNAYGFVVNPLGAAVGGFPLGVTQPATNITFRNVHVLRQEAAVHEVISLAPTGTPVNDPVGALFILHNRHPDTDALLTISSEDPNQATYIGNPLANAQALVAKAALAGEFPPFLDVSRQSLSPAVLSWIEGQSPLSTLASSPSKYLCNGDTMFHVNKGVIGFKMDGAHDVRLVNTSVHRLRNFGQAGSTLCGNYNFSHPQATLPGYGGARVRGYSVAGTTKLVMRNTEIRNLQSAAGDVIGVDVLTDSSQIRLRKLKVRRLNAGNEATPSNLGFDAPPNAIGVSISNQSSDIQINNLQTNNFNAFGASYPEYHQSP